MRKFLLILTLPFFVVCTVVAGVFIKIALKEGLPSMQLEYWFLWTAIFLTVISLGIVVLASRSHSSLLIKLCLIFGILGMAQNLFLDNGRDHFTYYMEDIFFAAAFLAFIPSAILALQAIRRFKIQKS